MSGLLLMWWQSLTQSLSAILRDENNEDASVNTSYSEAKSARLAVLFLLVQ